MRRHLFSLALFALLALMFANCGGSRDDGRYTEPRTSIIVDNRQVAEMRIYIVRGSQRLRLGTVPAASKRVFVIPEHLLTATPLIRFLADPIGGRALPVSQEISVSPGEQVELIIRP